jgi:hypothetical protein
MKRIILAVAICLLSVPAFARLCPDGGIAPPGFIFVCGSVDLTNANYIDGSIIRYYQPKRPFNVRFCSMNGACYTTQTLRSESDPSIYEEFVWQAPGAYGSCTSNANYNVYVWGSDEYGRPFGSMTVPVNSIVVPNCGLVGEFYPTPPSPLSPTPLTPYDGQSFLPHDFRIEWDSGRSAISDAPLWPATYDIYYKYWPWYETTEPANYTLAASGMSCNMDENMRCSTTITNMPDGNYKWYVVLNTDVTRTFSISHPAYYNPTIFSYTSPVAYFGVGFTGRPPGCCR